MDASVGASHFPDSIQIHQIFHLSARVPAVGTCPETLTADSFWTLGYFRSLFGKICGTPMQI